MAASSRVDFVLSPSTISQIDQLKLAMSQLGDERRIDRSLQSASLAAARAMVRPVRSAAPKRTGRLGRAVWANPVQRDKPGAYVGIRAGDSRADTKGAYYRWIVTSGVRKVPYTIQPNRKSGFQAIKLPRAGIGGVGDKGIRNAVTRTSPIKGRPFVTETVNKNLDLAMERFNEALQRTIQAGINKNVLRIPKPR